MKVFFLNDVPTVAKKGDIKDVAQGYFRNYLLPKGFAKIATQHVIEGAKHIKKVSNEQRRGDVGQMSKLAQALDGFEVVVHAKASETGTLFGSVTARVIAKALEKAGHTVLEKWIQLDHPMKEIGKRSVAIELPHGKKATISVEVVKE